MSWETPQNADGMYSTTQKELTYMSTLENSHPEIPHGIYCYGLKCRCPHWDIDLTKPDQDNGMCRLLGVNDWEDDGIGMLWDQLKICGINDEMEEGDF